MMHNFSPIKAIRNFKKSSRLPDSCWVKFHIPYLNNKQIKCDCIDYCKFTPPNAMSLSNNKQYNKKYINSEQMYA